MGKIKALSLFSGIGGLDLAAEMAGISPVVMCEINEFCRDILHKRWVSKRNIKIMTDVHDVCLQSIGHVDLIFGGFPCQDLSIAGRKEGLEGERSGLWYEMFRVIRDIRPNYVVIENVRGAVNLALDTIKSSMEEEGYQIWPILLPASAFGAPHQRERLFVIGVKRNIVENSRCKLLSWTSQFREGTGTTGSTVTCNIKHTGGTSSIMADTRAKRLQRCKLSGEVDNTDSSTFITASECGKITGNERKVNGQLNPDWVEQLMGFPEGWTNPDIEQIVEWQGWPTLLGMKQFSYEFPRISTFGKNRKPRLQALGNAVVPVQAYPIFRAIVLLDKIIRIDCQ